MIVGRSVFVTNAALGLAVQFEWFLAVTLLALLLGLIRLFQMLLRFGLVGFLGSSLIVGCAHVRLQRL